MDDTDPLEVEISGSYVANTLNSTLKGLKLSRELKRYEISNSILINSARIIKVFGGNHRFTHFNFITNYSPEIKAVFLEGDDANWEHPSPTGKFYVYSE